MQKGILKLANQKFKKLQLKYDRFINVIVDDWRGPRFVFDTEDVRQCKNNCSQCPLFQLLKDEKEGLFSAGLYPASKKDEKLFGPQKYLNCKTLEQYKNCYVNYLLKETNTKEEIEHEINLLRSMKIIFSRSGDTVRLEKEFKDTVISEVLKQADFSKRKIIVQSRIMES